MKRVKLWGAMGIFIMILLKPQVAVNAAQHAMGIWYTSVAPTLFPFLALMPLLTSEYACTAYETIFSGCMQFLFGLPGSAAPAVIVGMVAGSPGGAIALRRIAGNTKMKKEEAQRIALAVSGVSPAYLIMGIGQGLYGSTRLGVKLAGIQFCIQMILLILLPRRKQNQDTLIHIPVKSEGKKPILGAVESLLIICGYMVFFSIIAAVMADMIGERIGTYLLLILDLPSGMAKLAATQVPGKLVLLGVTAGFGGLCIGCQNMDIHKDIGLQWKDYLKVRIIAAILFAWACIIIDVPEMQGNIIAFGNQIKNYAVGLFITACMAMPVLYLLTNKLFLNNQKAKKNKG